MKEYRELVSVYGNADRSVKKRPERNGEGPKLGTVWMIVRDGCDGPETRPRLRPNMLQEEFELFHFAPPVYSRVLGWKCIYSPAVRLPRAPFWV